MRLLQRVMDYLFAYLGKPTERAVRQRLEAQPGCDGLLLFKLGCPYPGTITEAEWKSQAGTCTVSWTHSYLRDPKQQLEGSLEIPPSRFKEHIARLDELLDSNAIEFQRGKDCPWYSVGWLSPTGRIRSLFLNGSLIPGRCCDVIQSIQEDIPKAPMPTRPGSKRKRRE
jgi:hypothetical protein